jgi:hypothetical protein
MVGLPIYLPVSLPKSVPNAGDQLAPLYLALLRCLFDLTVFFRLRVKSHAEVAKILLDYC